MKTTKFFSIGLIAILVFIFSQQSFAQLPQVYIYNSPGYINTINTALTNSVMSNYLKKGGSGVSRSKSSSQSASYEVVPDYRRYPAVQFKSTGTRLTVKELAEILDPVPADRPETEKMLSGILDKYEAAARAKGYPNDWALAFVSFVGLNSYIYQGKTEQLIIPFEQNVGVRDVIAEYATDNGIFNNVTDRQKQELYEILVMLGGINYHFYQKAVREKNSEGIKNCKLFAAQNLKTVGIKL
jgi:hypothetical protein